VGNNGGGDLVRKKGVCELGLRRTNRDEYGENSWKGEWKKRKRKRKARPERARTVTPTKDGEKVKNWTEARGASPDEGNNVITRPPERWPQLVRGRQKRYREEKRR